MDGGGLAGACEGPGVRHLEVAFPSMHPVPQ